MNKFDLDYIPVLDKATKWEKLSDNQYLIYNDILQIRLYVSYSAYLVIRAINGISSVRFIADILTKGDANDSDYRRISDLIRTELGGKGLVYSSNFPYTRVRTSSHIYFEHIIVSEKYLQVLLPILAKLFKQRIVLIVICICCFMVIFAFYFPITNTVSTSSNICILTASFVFLVFSHEFGHCSALQYYREKSKGIGFGFYFFAPVLYADVNACWKLSYKQRAIVDLGGFYFQFITTSIYYIAYRCTFETAFLDVVYISLVSLIFNVNPLIKSDGYWFLSDIFNIDNLNKIAFENFSKLFMLKKDKELNIALCIFCFIKIVFILAFFIFATYNIIKTFSLVFTNSYTISFYNVIKDIISLIGLVAFVIEIKRHIKKRQLASA